MKIKLVIYITKFVQTMIAIRNWLNAAKSHNTFMILHTYKPSRLYSPKGQAEVYTHSSPVCLGPI